MSSDQGAGEAKGGRAAVGGHPRDGLARVLTLWDASMLIVASVVGAGIFLTPGQVATLLPSASWILLAWLTGALLSLAGALANAELASMFPRAGGDYVYLREGLHPVAGFLVGWLSFFAIYAGTVAALAIVLGDAVASALLGAVPGDASADLLGESLSSGGASGGASAGSSETGRLASLGFDRDRIRVIVAAIVILACSAVNVRGVRLGAQATNLTSVFKIVAVVLFVVLGLGLGQGDFAPWSRSAEAGLVAENAAAEIGSWPLRFGAALSPVLFSFLGWNASVYVASEIRDPERNVPRSLFWGLAICSLLYLAVNAVYFYALSPEALQAAPDAGAAAARALFGPAAGRWVSVFVLVSVLGTLNATVLTGPRVAFAMALDGLFRGPTDRVHVAYRTPAIAIWVQSIVAILLVTFLENFPNALDFTVFAIVLATSADVLALFALRRSQPDRPRPVRTWGYPWVPAVYLLANLAVAVSLVFSQPIECAVALAMLAVGLLIYCTIFRGGRPLARPGPEPALDR